MANSTGGCRLCSPIDGQWSLALAQQCTLMAPQLRLKLMHATAIDCSFQQAAIKVPAVSQCQAPLTHDGSVYAAQMAAPSFVGRQAECPHKKLLPSPWGMSWT